MPQPNEKMLRPPAGVTLTAYDAARLKRLLTLFGTTEEEILGAQESVSVVPDEEGLVRKAREIKAARLTRVQFLPPSFFGEPGWDILIELFLAHGHRRINLASLTAAIRTPPTSVLRWVTVLNDKGLVTTQKSSLDARISIIALTESALEIMRSYLRTLPRTI